MTALGGIFLLLIVGTLLFKRSLFVWVLALSAAFPASAAINVAGISISPFYLTAAVAATLLLFDKRRIGAAPGRVALFVFVAWSVLMTLLSPLIFSGIPVLNARLGLDNAIEDQTPLTFTISSIAQAAYLCLATCVLVYLVRERVSPLIAALPLGVGTALSSLNAAALTFGLPWPSAFFDTNPAVVYSTRLRGVFTEPSEFAGFSVGAAAFFIVMAARSRGWKRVFAVVFTVLAAVNINLASSGTALIGIIAFAVLGVGALLWHLMSRGGAGVVLVTLGGLTVAIAWVIFGDALIARGLALFNEKVGSDSLDNRSGADVFSLQLAQQTFGFGVGLGANRPSSFAAMLLSCVGVVGIVSFAWFLTRVARRASRIQAYSPAVWGLVAVLIVKVVSLPDLSTPILWLLIAVCARGAWAPAEASLREDTVATRAMQLRDRPLVLAPQVSAPVEVPGMALAGTTRRAYARERDSHRGASTRTAPETQLVR